MPRPHQPEILSGTIDDGAVNTSRAAHGAIGNQYRQIANVILYFMVITEIYQWIRFRNAFINNTQYNIAFGYLIIDRIGEPDGFWLLEHSRGLVFDIGNV